MTWTLFVCLSLCLPKCMLFISTEARKRNSMKDFIATELSEFSGLRKHKSINYSVRMSESK